MVDKVVLLVIGIGAVFIIGVGMVLFLSIISPSSLDNIFYNSKPTVSLNPDYETAMNEMLSHHPNIEQYHVNTALDQITNTCVQYGIEKGEGDNTMLNTVCNHFAYGMVTGNLEELGYEFK